MVTVTLYEIMNLIDDLQYIEIVDHESRSVLVSGHVNTVMVPFTRLNDFVKEIYVDQISEKNGMVIEI